MIFLSLTLRSGLDSMQDVPVVRRGRGRALDLTAGRRPQLPPAGGGAGVPVQALQAVPSGALVGDLKRSLVTGEGKLDIDSVKCIAPCKHHQTLSQYYIPFNFIT